MSVSIGEQTGTQELGWQEQVKLTDEEVTEAMKNSWGCPWDYEEPRPAGSMILTE